MKDLQALQLFTRAPRISTSHRHQLHSATGVGFDSSIQRDSPSPLTHPLPQRVQRRMNRSAVFRQAVFHARGDFGVHGASHDAVALEGAQLLGEHFWRDAVERAFEVGEAAHFALEEQKNDVELPTPTEQRERFPDTRGRAVRPQAFLTCR